MLLQTPRAKFLLRNAIDRATDAIAQKPISISVSANLFHIKYVLEELKLEEKRRDSSILKQARKQRFLKKVTKMKKVGKKAKVEQPALLELKAAEDPPLPKDPPTVEQLVGAGFDEMTARHRPVRGFLRGSLAGSLEDNISTVNGFTDWNQDQAACY